MKNILQLSGVGSVANEPVVHTLAELDVLLDVTVYTEGRNALVIVVAAGWMRVRPEVPHNGQGEDTIAAALPFRRPRLRSLPFIFQTTYM
eukprot:SAG22_NODE_2564_length_2435_cov_3.836473_2_plen_90_part_00